MTAVATIADEEHGINDRRRVEPVWDPVGIERGLCRHPQRRAEGIRGEDKEDRRVRSPTLTRAGQIAVVGRSPRPLTNTRDQAATTCCVLLTPAFRATLFGAECASDLSVPSQNLLNCCATNSLRSGSPSNGSPRKCSHTSRRWMNSETSFGRTFLSALAACAVNTNTAAIMSLVNSTASRPLSSATALEGC